MKTTIVLGMILYVVGLILGLLIAGSMIMADVEANFYGFDDLSQGRFSTLRCPPYIDRNEVGTIRATISNPLDRFIQPVVRTDLSSPTLGFTSKTQISLEPGQSQTLEWKVDKANIDLGSFIFAKVYIYSVYPLPLREATCGIFVINLPLLKGDVWLSLGLVLSLACLIGGVVLLARENRPTIGRPRERIYALLALVIFLVAAIVCGLLGWWVPGGLLLAVCILLMAVMLYLLI